MCTENRAEYDKRQAALVPVNRLLLERAGVDLDEMGVPLSGYNLINRIFRVAAQQRLAFAAAFALHDGFVLGPRAYTLDAVPTLTARPGVDGRPWHPMRALVLEAATRWLGGAYMPASAVVGRARAQGRKA